MSVDDPAAGGGDDEEEDDDEEGADARDVVSHHSIFLSLVVVCVDCVDASSKLMP
jgi:hypothetical protein